MMAANLLEAHENLRRHLAHGYVKNSTSNSGCAAITAQQFCSISIEEKSDRTRWHQQDHDVEEVRLL
jgi:hypothetical protein